MVLNSLTFAVFFAVVPALHNLPLSWSVTKLNLLVASYVLYDAWNPPLISERPCWSHRAAIAGVALWP